MPKKHLLEDSQNNKNSSPTTHRGPSIQKAISREPKPIGRVKRENIQNDERRGEFYSGMNLDEIRSNITTSTLDNSNYPSSLNRSQELSKKDESDKDFLKYGEIAWEGNLPTSKRWPDCNLNDDDVKRLHAAPRKILSSRPYTYLISSESESPKGVSQPTICSSSLNRSQDLSDKDESDEEILKYGKVSWKGHPPKVKTTGVAVKFPPRKNYKIDSEHGWGTFELESPSKLPKGISQPTFHESSNRDISDFHSPSTESTENNSMTVVNDDDVKKLCAPKKNFKLHPYRGLASWESELPKGIKPTIHKSNDRVRVDLHSQSTQDSPLTSSLSSSTFSSSNRNKKTDDNIVDENNRKLQHRSPTCK